MKLLKIHYSINYEHTLGKVTPATLGKESMDGTEDLYIHQLTSGRALNRNECRNVLSRVSNLQPAHQK